MPDIDKDEARATKASGKQEFHLFARFQPGATAARVGIFLSERAARAVGSKLFWSVAREVYYKVRPRRQSTRPYRRPRHATSRASARSRTLP